MKAIGIIGGLTLMALIAYDLTHLLATGDLAVSFKSGKPGTPHWGEHPLRLALAVALEIGLFAMGAAAVIYGIKRDGGGPPSEKSP